MSGERIRIALPCHFGLEAVLKREVTDLGYEIEAAEDGRVTFAGDLRAAAEANVYLRTAERVMLEAGRFEARTFDELFEAVRAVPWENWIPRDGKIWIRKASSVSSALFSPSDIQSIVKKAIVSRLSGKYGIEWFPEDGPVFPVRIFIRKDVVSVCIDTSGDSLHKRGYRVSPVIAPLSETLAAGLILLSPWRRGRILADPCCGSGTIPIEAAMIASGIAPGLHRSFLMETWEHLSGAEYVADAKEEAQEKVLPGAESDLQGYDIDPRAVRFARENAEAAGVGGQIHFQARPLAEFSHAKKYGFMITNPPYGQRIENEQTLPELYRTFARVYASLDSWSMYIITAYEDAERYIGRKADRNRKIYNGMIRTKYLQYIGPRPPKRDGAGREHGE